MEPEDRETGNTPPGEDADGGNVVRFPREWVGPLEELVPLGPGAGGGPDDGSASGDVVRADFWGEDSADVQFAVEAPGIGEGGDGDDDKQAENPDVARVRRAPRFPSSRAAALAVVAGAMALLAVGSVFGAGALLGSRGHGFVASASLGALRVAVPTITWPRVIQRNGQATHRRVAAPRSTQPERNAQNHGSRSAAITATAAPPAPSSASGLPVVAANTPIYTAQRSPAVHSLASASLDARGQRLPRHVQQRSTERRSVHPRRPTIVKPSI